GTGLVGGVARDAVAHAGEELLARPGSPQVVLRRELRRRALAVEDVRREDDIPPRCDPVGHLRDLRPQPAPVDVEQHPRVTLAARQVRLSGAVCSLDLDRLAHATDCTCVIRVRALDLRAHREAIHPCPLSSLSIYIPPGGYVSLHPAIPPGG